MTTAEPCAILVVTMPGFGLQTLACLHADPRWPRKGVRLCIIGRPPGPARRTAARIRLWWKGPTHRLAELADTTLSASLAARWLATAGYPYEWVHTDAEVGALRRMWRPSLTLTISSRIIFSAQTLASSPGEWWNLHPGLLPHYAGASPTPYMFADGRAGCSIHRMVDRVDAGPLLDVAELGTDLGRNGGELYFERLPQLAAARLLDLLTQRQNGRLSAWPQQTDPLMHRTAARLLRDRTLRWQQSAARLIRWVEALMPFAPALLKLPDGTTSRVFEAVAVPDGTASRPGTVLEVKGRSVTVACMDHAVRLHCDRRVRVAVGSLLPEPIEVS